MMMQLLLLVLAPGAGAADGGLDLLLILVLRAGGAVDASPLNSCDMVGPTGGGSAGGATEPLLPLTAAGVAELLRPLRGAGAGAMIAGIAFACRPFP